MLGRLLDTLVVKIVGDIADFRAKMIEAAHLTEQLGRHVGDTLGRQFDLGDAIHAGIALPMIAAATVVSARSAQMVRDITAARTALTGAAAVAALPAPRPGASPPATRPNIAAAAVPAAIAGALTIPGAARVVDDDRRRGLLYPRLRAAEAAASGELDDSYARRYAGDIARGGGVAPAPILAMGPHDPEMERRRAARTREEMRQAREEERPRRQHGGTLSDDARERLSGAAHRAGQGVRGAMGSGIARAMGLTGLGALIGSLIPLVGELATLIGTGLVAALSALATPLGLVVAALGGLVALFAMTRWEDFRNFIDWVASEASAQWERFAGSVMSGLRNVGDAFKRLGETLFGGQGGDTFAALFLGFLQLLVATCTRAFAALGEIIESGLNAFAAFVNAIDALIRGDWDELWKQAVILFKTVFIDSFVNVIDAFFPGFREGWETFWRGVGDVFGVIWDGIAERFQGVLGRIREGWNAFTRGVFGRSGGELLDLVDRAQAGDQAAIDELRRRGQKSGGGGKSGRGGAAKSAYDEGKLPPGMRGDDETAREVNAFAAYLGGQLSGALKAMLRGQRVTIRDFFGAVLSDIADLLIDRLANSIVSLVDRALGGLGGAGGGIWDALGSLFGGGGYQTPGYGGAFAKGGFLAPGKWGIVGERGPEIVQGGRAGMTISPMAGGGALYMPISISAPGADPMQLARVVQEVRQLRADMPALVAVKVGDMRQRGRL
ncbi:MAG: hypothetical protein GC206_13485 [Alphaproteobacteria bacterium]|nr:hypothetical protein [Alphaproteobacteria bacterium]